MHRARARTIHLAEQAVNNKDSLGVTISSTDYLLYFFLLFFSLQELEFHGVMRFYFQDRVAGNFATKCIRVSSTATTQDVIETLAEKFRPDMRMLSSPKYSLYEVHVSGGE